MEDLAAAIHTVYTYPAVANIYFSLPRTASSIQYEIGPHSQTALSALNTMLKRICMISNMAPFSRAIWSSMFKDLEDIDIWHVHS